MNKTALACAVALAALFTTGAQADAAGYKRDKPHAGYHYKAQKKKVLAHTKAKRRAHAFHKTKRNVKAKSHFRHRYAKWSNRRGKRYHLARRYR